MVPFSQTHWVWWATVGADRRASQAWEELRLFLYPFWRLSLHTHENGEVFLFLLRAIFSPTSTPDEIADLISMLDPEHEWMPGVRIARQEMLFVASDSTSVLNHLLFHMLHHLQLMDTKVFVANDDNFS